MVHQKWFRQVLRRRFFVILLLVLLSKQEKGEAAEASPVFCAMDAVYPPASAPRSRVRSCSNPRSC